MRGDRSGSLRDEPHPLLHYEKQLSEFSDIAILEEGYPALHNTKYQKSAIKGNQHNSSALGNIIKNYPISLFDTDTSSQKVKECNMP